MRSKKEPVLERNERILRGPEKIDPRGLPGFIPVEKYRPLQQIWQGEIGRVGNVKYFENGDVK